ncbi:hypothetical protein DMW44_21280, partial [Serratia marcescens]
TLLDRLPMLHQPGELWLNVEVVQPQATDWSEAHHRCAWDQWRGARAPPPPPPPPPGGPPPPPAAFIPHALPRPSAPSFLLY